MKAEYEYLAAELAEMGKKVQRAIAASPQTGKGYKPVTNQSLDKMRRIIEQFGWPTKEMVGEQARYYAYLIVLHADSDPGFQKHCLKLMQQSATVSSDLSLKDMITKLSIRVLRNRGNLAKG
jgi:hypothetical protein